MDQQNVTMPCGAPGPEVSTMTASNQRRSTARGMTTSSGQRGQRYSPYYRRNSEIQAARDEKENQKVSSCPKKWTQQVMTAAAAQNEFNSSPPAEGASFEIAPIFETTEKNKKNSNFLKAYPTKKISDKILQSLLPDDWSRTRVVDFNRVNNPVVKIDPFEGHQGFEAFIRVVKKFDCPIYKVEKIENPYLWLMFRLTAIYNNEVLKLDSQQVFLYHGTNIVNVDSIALDNFNYRRAGNNKGTRFGAGVNFSAAPVFARKYAFKGKCMILSRVLQGWSSLGNQKTVLPEPGCDSTRNEGHIVVKFHDHEFYPEFLLYYSEPWQGI